MRRYFSIRKALSTFDRIFLHPKHRTYGYQLKKARLFVTLPVTVIVIGLCCIAISCFFGDSNEMPHIFLGTFLCLIPLWFFRKYGSMLWTGNMLTAIFAITVGEAVFRTGGLYSDNLLWLMLAPMLAMLFSGKKSGFVWLALLCLFTLFLLWLEPGGAKGFRQENYKFDNQYFVTSYIALFVAYTIVVSVFVKGSEILVKELMEQKDQCQLKTDEATQKALALEVAQAKLGVKNRELEQFAYVASHDLREPLRMITAYTELLNRRVGAQLDETSKEFLQFAMDGSARMGTMLNDLLEFARLGNEGEKSVALDLNKVLRQATANLSFLIQETNTKISCDTLPSVIGSETQLVRLFQNLLSNSIKFSKKGIAPEITIKHQLDSKRIHSIYFQDNGIGIPAESRDRIFNVFERLHAKSEFEGSGIGLAACKKIVENMGGNITVVDAEGNVGTRFRITFPYSATVPMTDTKEPDNTNEPQRGSAMNGQILAWPIAPGFNSWRPSTAG